MQLGILATSRRENEYRVPIHPAHLTAIPESVRAQLVFEVGYGNLFGVTDVEIAAVSGGLAERHELLQTADIAVLAKPMEEDFEEIREHGILWGWVHCVLQRTLTQLAIDRRLTIITWEAMYENEMGGSRPLHTFHRNNEMAGYAGVLHATGCAGIDGFYGPPRTACIIGYGYAGQGAVRALRALGFRDIQVFTQRAPHMLDNRQEGVVYQQIARRFPEGTMVVEADGGTHPFLDNLRQAAMIVNCTVQDPEAPLMFITEQEVNAFNHHCLIVDISCDPGMGFPFARTTTFHTPTFKVGDVTFCSVDHTPGYLWDSTSWEISQALLPYLPTLIGGIECWNQSKTIRRAIEISSGVVRNPKILSYQRREAEYPHRPLLPLTAVA